MDSQQKNKSMTTILGGLAIVCLLFLIFPRVILFISEAGITFVRFWWVIFGFALLGGAIYAFKKMRPRE